MGAGGRSLWPYSSTSTHKAELRQNFRALPSAASAWDSLCLCFGFGRFGGLKRVGCCLTFKYKQNHLYGMVLCVCFGFCLFFKGRWRLRGFSIGVAPISTSPLPLPAHLFVYFF